MHDPARRPARTFVPVEDLSLVAEAAGEASVAERAPDAAATANAAVPVPAAGWSLWADLEA
jgi:hypothetical protein